MAKNNVIMEAVKKWNLLSPKKNSLFKLAKMIKKSRQKEQKSLKCAMK
jgi:hypothetical protein